MNDTYFKSLEKRRIERLLMGYGLSLKAARKTVAQGWRFHWLARFSFMLPIFLLLARIGNMRDVEPKQSDKRIARPREVRRATITGRRDVAPVKGPEGRKPRHS